MKLNVAAVQMAPVFDDPAANQKTIVEWLQRAADAGARLVVLPECAHAGYMARNPQESAALAQPVPGPFSGALLEACSRLNVYAVVGMLERQGDVVYNTALLAGPEGLLGRYHKSHLPVLGVDRFARPGDSLDVFETPIGSIGILVCYDMRFPEAPRVLALKGAELIVHPTNWPRASSDFPDFVTKAAARASGVFLVSCNRVGQERGADFLGRSQIIAPSGRPLSEADDHSEMMIQAELDLAQAHQKKVIHIPGEFELDSFGDRRPELYSALVQRD
jgi:predicted amidohydrolase